TTQVTGTGTVSTSPFSTTAAGEVLLALVASDGPGQTVTVSGAGLTWSLVKRGNTQPGDVEIWTATAPSILSSVTATSQPSIPGYDQLLTVLAVQGAAGVGSSAASSG